MKLPREVGGASRLILSRQTATLLFSNTPYELCSELFRPSSAITGAKALEIERTQLVIAGPWGRLTERPRARKTAAAWAPVLTAGAAEGPSNSRATCCHQESPPLPVGFLRPRGQGRAGLLYAPYLTSPSRTTGSCVVVKSQHKPEGLSICPGHRVSTWISLDSTLHLTSDTVTTNKSANHILAPCVIITPSALCI